MPDLTLVPGSEFENYLSVERDWNTEVSQKVPKLGFFWKEDEFFPRTCMISVKVGTFV